LPITGHLAGGDVELGERAEANLLKGV